MTKALSSFPENRRRDIALRRASNNVRGNGFWGALDYLVRFGIRIPTSNDKAVAEAVAQHVIVVGLKIAREEQQAN